MVAPASLAAVLAARAAAVAPLEVAAPRRVRPPADTCAFAITLRLPCVTNARAVEASKAARASASIVLRCEF